ncbi:stage II sporulation protein M [Candidatus Pacearchaeota archaeon]|nr:stage II sporulation protein M [Candidatus Pacearchaeota archaeon]
MVKKKSKKKDFNLKQEYKESWKYLKDSKNYIYFSIGIFLIFTLIGFFIPAPEHISEKIISYLKQLIELTQGMDSAELFEFIFLNNIKSTFMGIFMGIFLGIIPLVGLIMNGYLLGFVAAMSVSSEGFGILWNLVPHGIFELPAIFISLGLGLKLGTFAFKENRIKYFKDYIWNSLRIFLLIVLPLLIIAALIEGYLIAFSS